MAGWNPALPGKLVSRVLMSRLKPRPTRRFTARQNQKNDSSSVATGFVSPSALLLSCTFVQLFPAASHAHHW
jgi:hypothetical protein